MSALVFDTLAYARRMEQVGFTREQAETLAQEQAKLIDERLATKTDIEALRLATKTDIEALRLATKSDIEAFRLAIKADMREFQRRMTIRFGGMLVVAVGVLLAAIRYLPAH